MQGPSRKLSNSSKIYVFTLGHLWASLALSSALGPALAFQLSLCSLEGLWAGRVFKWQPVAWGLLACYPDQFHGNSTSLILHSMGTMTLWTSVFFCKWEESVHGKRLSPVRIGLSSLGQSCSVSHLSIFSPSQKGNSGS